MPSRVLPGIGLQGFWDLGEPWKSGGDANWLKLSVMVQLVAESATAALPASPVAGDVYIVPASDATNKWKVAVYDSGAWSYYTAPTGAQAWVKDVAKRMRFDPTSGWVVDGGGSAGGFAPVVTEAGSTRTIDPVAAGSYIRFTATGAKIATFTSSLGYAADQEFHLTNRGSGDLTLQATGVTLNAPKGGLLTLEQGDTVTVKFITPTMADVFGSVKAAP